MTWLKSIRKKLLLENRFKKYLLYAFGEVLIITFGILIAMQITKYNSERSDREKEAKILRQIQVEFQENQAQLNEKIRFRNEIVRSSKIILNFIDNPIALDIDTFFYHMHRVIRVPTFDPVSNDLIGSGNIRLIQNDTLRNLLQNWESDVFQLQEVELEWMKIRTGIGLPLLGKLGIGRNIQHMIWKDGYPYIQVDPPDMKRLDVHFVEKSPKRVDLERIFKDVEFEGFVSSSSTWSQIGNLESIILSHKIDEILEIITRELER